jgi:hypothetical protein
MNRTVLARELPGSTGFRMVGTLASFLCGNLLKLCRLLRAARAPVPYPPCARSRPKAVKDRHAFAYFPFSLGPRISK